MSARSGVDSLHVEFPGMVVRIGPDATTAVAELTARGRIGSGEEFVQELRLTLKKNGRLALAGFGTFSVTERKAREGRNPQTGKPIKIPATKVVKFKPGKQLKDLVK